MEYCDIQKNCKVVQQAVAQYDKVVEQNRSLQRDLRSKEEEINAYRRAIITLMTSIYETYSDFFDDKLNVRIEEFLMVEKEKLC